MTLPYHRRELLTPTELSFYHILKETIGHSLLICPKVGLGDIFYSKTGNWGDNRTNRNKIDRKHVDFVLCDPTSIRPIICIELDDLSHNRPDRQERDRFVEEVFRSAGLPLFRQPVAQSYDKTALLAGLKELTEFNINPTTSQTPTTTMPQILNTLTNQIDPRILIFIAVGITTICFCILILTLVF